MKGRIWLAWNPNIWSITPIEKTEQLVHSDVYTNAGTLSHHLTIVYAHNQINNRRSLWQDLSRISNNIQGPWMVVGDFNNILKVGDIIGGNDVHLAEYIDMELIMANSNLFEHEMIGAWFTWSNKQIANPISSIIDRALVNADSYRGFPNTSVEVLNPHISDHAPLRIKMDSHQAIKKIKHRFKFLNCIAGHADYLHGLRANWNHLDLGNPMEQFWKNLYKLQYSLKGLTWQMTEGIRDLKVSREQLDKAQTLLAFDQLNQTLCQNFKFWTDEVLKNTELEENILQQKLKCDWITLVMRSQVDICSLREGAQLNREQQESLTVPVTEAEIWKAINGMGDNKAPGVDGYNAKFYKSSWTVIKKDVVNVVQDFFVNNRMYRAVNCALVTLIPKTKDAKSMKEMRPIACCTTLYKIISKVLTKRLNKVINSVNDSQTTFLPGKTIHDNIILAFELLRGYNRKHLSPRCTIQIDLQKAYDTVEWDSLALVLLEKCVSEEQSAFVEGRSILNNAMIATEIIHTLKRRTKGNKAHLALKIDISKAYDRVDWGFLRGMLSYMGFADKWIHWMMMCVTSIHYSVLVNSDVIGPIELGRGLRQGDPLSPYLFILISEGLSTLIKGSVASGNIHGVQICRGAPIVSHLLFADDCFLFCRANLTEVRHLMGLLDTYASAAGQEINLTKSEVFFSRNLSLSA
ncbi:uncharacterized protein LOC131613927 [Vicia villosa]|uniref:uncharacterized protein LOC131613927 n=1 Tax=Vicia villosa TaxID=3911 RepID=UPI00273AF47B|nr:uncharacterized protein LOC131613927 [Vicia villosa]